MLPPTWRSCEKTPHSATTICGGVQWTEVDRAHRLRLALHASRPATVGSRLPADQEVAGGWRIRADGPRLARTFAPFGGESVRILRQPYLTPAPCNPRLRAAPWWLRRAEAQEGIEGTRGGGHFRTSARLTREPSLGAGARVCGRVSPDRARGDGESVELAYVDQGYTGERPAKKRRLMA